MVDYTEQAGNSSSYNESITGDTVWDSGATEWDLNGNVATAYWDKPDLTAYSTESGDTPIWVDQ